MSKPFIGVTIGVVATLMLLATATTFFSFGQQANSAQNAPGHKYQWDFIQISVVGSVATITAGGMGIASGEPPVGNITITGEGTFVVGSPDQVTGGGTWSVSTGSSGTFKVTQLISFVQDPGTILTVFKGSGITVHDKIDGGATDSRAGVAILRVHYSDGSDGVLTFVCNLTGAAGFEGITMTKAGVDYFLPSDPLAATPVGVTLFHIIDN
jgi:hypothetical protein